MSDFPILKGLVAVVFLALAFGYGRNTIKAKQGAFSAYQKRLLRILLGGGALLCALAVIWFAVTAMIASNSVATNSGAMITLLPAIILFITGSSMICIGAMLPVIWAMKAP